MTQPNISFVLLIHDGTISIENITALMLGKTYEKGFDKVKSL